MSAPSSPPRAGTCGGERQGSRVNRSLRVAALQLRAHDRAQFAATFSAIERHVDRICADADLVVLPEGTLPGYVLDDASIDDADVERALDALRAIAASKRAVIVAGAAVREGGRLYNAGVVIDRDGSVAGRADKVFLWHFDRRWFAAGTKIAPVDTSVGRLGVLICADGRMPGIARALVDAGAELLVMPTAWVSSGRDPHVLENPIADLLGRIRAYENGVPFVAADKCGVEREMVLYCGKSQIVAADGSLLALAGEREEEDLVAGIEIAPAVPHRAHLARLATRHAPVSGTFRLAVSAQPPPADVAQRMETLEAEYLLAPEAAREQARLDAAVPLAIVDDAIVRDPTGLGAYRRAGYRLAVWTTRTDEWTVRLARARAGENRIYVVAIDRAAGRAFVVDPDYTVVCGTFEGYRIATCTVDLAKTAQTVVVPGTDVAEGLERVAAMTS